MDHVEPRIEPTPQDDERERTFQNVLSEIERSGELPAHVHALDAVDAVLCALEMRLPRTQAEEVEDSLPPTLRALLGRCAVHKTSRAELSFGGLPFLRLIASVLHVPHEDQAERITRTVFSAVQRSLPEVEIVHVRNRLPRDINALWDPLDAQAERAPRLPPFPDEDELVGGRPVEEPTESILRELDASNDLPEDVTASEALEAVLCILSMQLTREEAQQLAETSPTFHDLIAPCIDHRDDPPPHVMDRPTFLHELAEHLGVEARAAERVARTVFAAVRGRLSADEVHKIDGRLRRDLRRLWAPRL